jgi:hypothetical protein
MPDKNKMLTAPASLLYSEGAKTNRAVSGLRRDAGRRFLVLGQFKPECLSVVRLGAVLFDRSNTRVFLLPGNAKTNRRCLMAQEQPGDRLNICASKLAFIEDALTQDKVLNFRMCEEGTAGLFYILSEIEKELNSVAKEV